MSDTVQRERPAGRREGLYALLVALALALVVAGTLAHAPAAGTRAGTGRARNVDVERLERLIRGGQLSGREAVYYRVLDGSSAEGAAVLPEPGERPPSRAPDAR